MRRINVTYNMQDDASGRAISAGLFSGPSVLFACPIELYRPVVIYRRTESWQKDTLRFGRGMLHGTSNRLQCIAVSLLADKTNGASIQVRNYRPDCGDQLATLEVVPARWRNSVQVTMLQKVLVEGVAS